jgi:vanillate O-demethylase monooxygenase subunit
MGRAPAFTIPHPGGQLPDGRLPVYPLVERHGLLWIWMGDPAKADPR